MLKEPVGRLAISFSGKAVVACRLKLLGPLIVYATASALGSLVNAKARKVYPPKLAAVAVAVSVKLAGFTGGKAETASPVYVRDRALACGS